MNTYLRPVSSEPICPPSVFSDGCCRSQSTVCRAGVHWPVRQKSMSSKPSFLTYVSLLFDVRQEKRLNMPVSTKAGIPPGKPDASGGIGPRPTLTSTLGFSSRCRQMRPIFPVEFQLTPFFLTPNTRLKRQTGERSAQWTRACNRPVEALVTQTFRSLPGYRNILTLTSTLPLSALRVPFAVPSKSNKEKVF